MAGLPEPTESLLSLLLDSVKDLSENLIDFFGCFSISLLLLFYCFSIALNLPTSRASIARLLPASIALHYCGAGALGGNFSAVVDSPQASFSAKKGERKRNITEPFAQGTQK